MSYKPNCDVKYILDSSKIIINALKSGYDVVQFGNGDVSFTEIVVHNRTYKWNNQSKKFFPE